MILPLLSRVLVVIYTYFLLNKIKKVYTVLLVLETRSRQQRLQLFVINTLLREYLSHTIYIICISKHANEHLIMLIYDEA